MKKIIVLLIILNLFLGFGKTYFSSSFAKENLNFSKQMLKDGKTLFKRHCITCHGIRGEGDGPGATNLNPKPRNLKKDKFKYSGESYNEVLKRISDGVPKSKNMLAWKNVLSQKELENVTAYVKMLRAK